MARYIYIRCSTDKQEYLQQKNSIDVYFKKYGISPDCITKTIEEHVSGYKVSYKDRQLSYIIDSLQKDDVLYVSDISRLSRRYNEIVEITSRAFEVGAIIVLCGYNMVLEKDSIATKSFLFGVGIGAEIQVMNISADTKRGLQARLALRDEQGFWVSKSGNICTHLGGQKGHDTSAARAASAKKKTDAAEEWRRNNVGFKFVKQMRIEGWNFKKILDEFLKMSKIDPSNYCTRTGKQLTGGTLSRWIKDIDKELQIEKI